MRRELLTAPTDQAPPSRQAQIRAHGLPRFEGALDAGFVVRGHVEGVLGEDAEDVVADEVEVEGRVDEEHFDDARAEEFDG